MKICITSDGSNLDSFIDPRFGRCLYFVFVDDKDPEKIKVLPNAGVNAMRGAGIQAAQTVVSQGAEVVITGNIGPNAFGVLQSSGVRVFQAVPGTKIKDAISAFERGQLSEITQSLGGGFGSPGGGRRGMGRGGGFGAGRRGR
jgi:predicted Fe-Mo cluster-binding NifX family protein